MNNLYHISDWRINLDPVYGNVLTLTVPVEYNESSELLMQSIVNRGKITLSPYVESENMAAKCRKQATANVIKHIYSGIEEQVENFGYVYTTFLRRNETTVLDEIVAEFEAKGFEVKYDPIAKHLRISW